MKTFFIFLIFPFVVSSQWVKQTIPPDITLILTVDFTSQNSGVAGGWVFDINQDGRGRMIYTTNSGSLWLNSQIPDSSRAMVEVQMINAVTGYTAGAYNISSQIDKDTYLRSRKYFNALPGHIRNFYERIGRISKCSITYKGLFLKTTNGGQSWFTMVTLPENVYYLVGMKFVNLNTGFVIASLEQQYMSKGGILKTTNTGQSWINLLTIEVSDLTSIYTYDGINIFVGGWGSVGTNFCGFILRSSNGGTNWVRQNYLNTDAGFNDFSFINANTGFTISIDTNYKAMIFKTINTGSSWTRLNYQPNSTLYNGIEFVSGTGKGIAVGSSSPGLITPIISRTTDYGNNWSDYLIMDTGFFVSSKLVDQNIWFVSGGANPNQATIYKSTNGGSIGIKPISSEIPSHFSLSQNYPNPFNPMTHLRFKISDLRFVKLLIYDILGREIASLVNEQLKPGVYEVEWDGSNYPSGVYFYRITAGDPSSSSGQVFVETKKMVLAK